MAMMQHKIDHIMPSAVCTSCGESKLVSEFRKDSSKPRNRDTKCKSCCADRDKVIFTKNAAFRAEAIAQNHNKRCRVCQEDKLVSEFPAQPRCRGGTSHECQSCFNIRHQKWYSKDLERSRAKGREGYRSQTKKRPGAQAKQSRKWRLKKKYGLTEACLADMNEKQNGLCAICSIKFIDKPWGLEAMNIDHDHETGVVRELLCTGCNSGLGYFRDNPDLIVKAAAYLLKHRGG